MLTDLKMFADGAGLSKAQLAELRDAGMLYSDGVQWMLTERGRDLLNGNRPMWLESTPAFGAGRICAPEVVAAQQAMNEDIRQVLEAGFFGHPPTPLCASSAWKGWWFRVR